MVRTYLSITVEHEVKERFRKFCEARGVSVSAALEALMYRALGLEPRDDNVRRVMEVLGV